MQANELLGSGVNVIHEASGIHIPMRDYGAVSFLSFLAAGTQSLSFDSATDGAGNAALAVVDRFWKGPGVGGTWELVTQAASDTVTNADATNDQVWVTIYAEDLPDGANEVECTAASGTCVAILHNGRQHRDPDNLPSSV